MKDEAEWLACTDPNAMLEWLEGPCRTGGNAVPQGVRLISDRKRWLFAAHWWRLLTPHSPQHEALALAVEESGRASRDGVDADSLIRECSHGYHELGPAGAALLREVVGNPFREVRLPLVRACWKCGRLAASSDKGANAVLCQCGIWHSGPAHCPWLTPPVLAVARAAYDDRDFALLPLVADALEDAGCAEESLLGHLRRPAVCVWCKNTKKVRSSVKKSGPFEEEYGPLYIVEPPTEVEITCPFCQGEACAPHVRGCWALDLILGKE